MRKTVLGALILLLFAATSCSDKDGQTITPLPKDLVVPKLKARLTEQPAADNPFTGILEIYPCNAESSIYYGNYVNGKRMIFGGYYTIVKGDVFGNNNREIHLPIGDYNMVYWGTPKHEEPIHNAPEIDEPGLTENVDLSQLYFKMRPYGDGTYKPVYDLVHAVQETSIGSEDLQAALVRVSAGLKVVLTQDDGSPFHDMVKSVKVHIGGIAEKLNFYTAEPENMTKTVRFDLTRSEDNTVMSNATVMLFPSSDHPLLELFITLEDNSIHKLSKVLQSSLSANTLLTLNVVIGKILPEGNPGDFTITDWDEANETIEFPVIE